MLTADLELEIRSLAASSNMSGLLNIYILIDVRPRLIRNFFAEGCRDVLSLSGFCPLILRWSLLRFEWSLALIVHSTMCRLS